jgi:putative DNA primase/helicase
VNDIPDLGGDFGQQLAAAIVTAGSQKARTKRKRPERAARSVNDKRPLITIAANDIARIVDEVEAALIAADLGLYQRGGKIVTAERVPAIAAGDKKITVTSICERGDMALREDASTAASFEKFDARADGMVTADPPMVIIQTLQQRGGRLRFPILAGVVHTPTMRADGSLLTKPGYDPATGLMFDPLGVDFPLIPDRPTRDDAVKALSELLYLIKDFPFVTEAHRAVALSAILTAMTRRSLTTAPFHAFSAPIRGSGKSKLVDIASVVATGEEAPVISAGGDDVELEKRLVASLIAGWPIITIDNCSRPIGGDLLCQMLTQAMVRPRILGKSETPTCPTGAFVAGTGQNFAAVGDMERRTIVSKIDPKMETPELRSFDFEPVALAKERRPQLVAAVLTILRAYHVAELPGKPAPLGSFETWSDRVRGALLWLDCADPVETMAEVRESDPETSQLRQVMTAWRETFGSEAITVSQLVKKAMEQQRANTLNGSPEFVNEDLREALLTVAGRGGGINNKGRRAAKVTQACVARALRAAQSAGPGWRVEIMPDGIIRLIQGELPSDRPSPNGSEPEPRFARGLSSAP